METPGDLKFAETHEWARLNDDGTVTVGISHHAQEQLGDLVFVEVPEVDAEVSAQDAVAVVESVKAASDIYAPVTGKVVAINEALADSPELINDNPFEDGWIFTLEPDNKDDLNSMMTAGDYDSMVQNA